MIKSVLTKEQQEKWSAYEATKKAEKRKKQMTIVDIITNNANTIIKL
ncbi:MAG: hypothetical protein R2836_00950 [Chitinophagales bacterium]